MKKTSKTSSAPAPAKKRPTAGRQAPPAVVKKTAPKPVVTTISARIDVGFGNTLYLRGEGPGLSWERGVVMECAGDDNWTLVLRESDRPLVFKFLINDEVWSLGEDYVAKPGASAVFAPLF